MLEKDPADRYQNLGLVAHALASVIGSASVGDDEPIRQRTTEKKSASATKTVTLSRTMLVLFFIAVAAMFSIAGYLFGTQNRGATGHPAPVAANPPATAREVDPHSPTDRALTQEAEKHFFGQEADDTTFVKMALQKPINGGEMSLTGIFLTRPMFKMVVDTNWVISTKWNSCHFIGHNFDLLSKKTNLNSLFASDTNFDDVDAAQISHSPNLERLEVARTGLTDKGIVEFARLKHLVNLQISETAVSGRGIAALANNPRLAVLRIRNCKEITDAALAPLAHSQLTTIDLSFIKPISDGALAYVEKDNHLVFVNLEGTGISAQGVDHMLSTNRSLQEVAIAGCPHISAQELEGLRQKFPSVIFSAPLSKSLP
jgi:hypothetical protein